MTKLRAPFIALIVIIGLSHSLSDLIEDPEYRPWDRNDTSTAGVFLSGMGIKSLNSMFRVNIPNLKWLVLDNNEIETITSDAFESFSELTYLSLARNDIHQIDYYLFVYLKKLEVLNLDGNKYFGESLKINALNELESLKRLYLRDCEITYFILPQLTSHLTHLHLSRNQIKTFYTSHESSMTHLYLLSNQLRYASLSKFKTLIFVDASHNRFTRIVRESVIPPHEYIPNFNDRESRLDSLDDTGLYLDDAAATLQYLSMFRNDLFKIEPNAFRDSKALIHVDLSSNSLIELGADTFNDLPQLEIISLEYNRIKVIYRHAFKNLPNLKTISLEHNQIEEIDEDTFSGLNSSANEVSLFLDYNRIHTLKKGAFRDATSLKHISLTRNMIKMISSQAFVNLPKLEGIVIEEQLPIHYFPFTANDDIKTYEQLMIKGSIESDAFYNLPNLTTIIIRANYFTDIEPRAFHNLPKLQSLDLSKNSIKNISSEAFSNLPELEALHLRENFITTITPNTFPQSLKHLDLASNLLCPRSDCWHVEELVNLEKLHLSEMFEQFTVNEFAGLPKNLTIVMHERENIPNPPVPCY